MSYEEMKASLSGTGDAGVAEEVAGVSITEALKDYSTDRKFPYSELMNNDALPETVDKTAKEMYLADEEFQEVFKMAREDFVQLPKWKQNGLKKKAKLF